MLVDEWSKEGEQYEEANYTYTRHSAFISSQPP